MVDNLEQDNLIELTAEIVSAYVSNNSIASADLSNLINDVHAAALDREQGEMGARARLMGPGR